MMTSTTTTLSYLLASVAAVSLLVGGIGVTNIMLVSVTERTREIGLRMSLGARRSDVRRQFLAEALVLSLAGGLAGIALGVGASWALSAGLQWTTAVSMRAVALSFGCAFGIGAFFGWVPARRAAALNPIEALRYRVTARAPSPALLLRKPHQKSAARQHRHAEPIEGADRGRFRQRLSRRAAVAHHRQRPLAVAEKRQVHGRRRRPRRGR